MRVTDEADPFFLYTLDVSEEEFGTLKHEQRLLVDFVEFPSQLVELVESCQRADGRFVAGLALSASGGALSVMEVNNFRQLYHISLQLRAGNDAAIKRYLAQRLTDFKRQTAELGASLEETRTELDATGRDAQELQAQLQQQTDQQQREVGEVEHRGSMALAREKEAAVAQLREQLSRAETERAKLAAAHEAEAAALRGAADELRAENKQLTAERYETESTVHDLRLGLKNSEADGRDSAERLRKATEQLQSVQVHQLEGQKRTNSDSVRLATLEQGMRDKQALLDKSEALVRSGDEQRAQQQAQVDELKAAVDKYERKMKASALEIQKGNEIIEQLSSDVQHSKSKAKLKGAVNRQQEALLREKEGAAAQSAADSSQLRSEIVVLTSDKERLQSELDASSAKLQESLKHLQSNQQVIAWLNKEMNDSHVGQRKAPGRAPLSTINWASKGRESPAYRTPVPSPSQLSTMNTPVVYNPRKSSDRALA